jgi:hypothetical protein
MIFGSSCCKKNKRRKINLRKMWPFSASLSKADQYSSASSLRQNLRNLQNLKIGDFSGFLEGGGGERGVCTFCMDITVPPNGKVLQVFYQDVRKAFQKIFSQCRRSPYLIGNFVRPMSMKGTAERRTLILDVSASFRNRWGGKKIPSHTPSSYVSDDSC